MRLPNEPFERLNCLRQLVTQLSVSRLDRRAAYSRLRSWYLYGGDGARARYNKIYPSIGTLAAYLYAQQTTRFAVSLGPSPPADAVAQAEAISERLRDVWHDSGADVLTASLVRWSAVYGLAALKFGWKDGALAVHGVDAGSLGVLREDLASLDAQDAILHDFQLGVEAVQRMLVAGGHTPDAATALIASLGPKPPDQGVPDNAVGELVIGLLNPISLGAPTSTGSAGGITNLSAASTQYTPAVDAKVLNLQELWIWDDALADYRIVTLIEKEFVLFDRANFFVPQEHPFVSLVLDPLDDYFWGYSQVDALIPLQAWREKRMNQLDRLMQRQVNPPLVFTGFMGGVQDEKAAAVMRRGGILANSQQPGAKVTELTPTMPPEVFEVIHEIDVMFDETIGLSPTLKGAGDAGVRGGEHAQMLLQSGSGRLLRRALNIEAGLEKAGTLLLKILRRYDPVVLRTDADTKFTLALFPEDAAVKVVSHSSSPLFAGALQQQALQLMELGIIDGESYIEMTDPPMSAVLKQRLKARQAQQKAEVAALLKQLPSDERAGVLVELLGGKKSAARKHAA